MSENGRRYEGEFRNDQMVGQPLDDFNPGKYIHVDYSCILDFLTFLEKPFMFQDLPSNLVALSESPVDVQKSLNAVALRYICKVKSITTKSRFSK